jgi:oxygen-dependent protoporphyrinogen oxidase
MSTGNPPHVVIVGGGIAGLAAAFFLSGEPVRVTVLEGSPRLGGKLAASDVAGVAMDEGAEALLARRTEGTDLVSAVGLGDALIPAGVTSSAIFTRGALRSLPRRQFMGVPADPGELAASGVLSAEGVARVRDEERQPAGASLAALNPAGPGDVSVTEYIGSRLGREVVDRLVDPLLGGVYAGRSEDLSFRATLAPLAAAAGRHRTLTAAVTSLLPPAPTPDNSEKPPAGDANAPTLGGTPASDAAGHGATAPGRPAPGAPGAPAPLFVSLTTGLGALPEAVAKASGADVRTNAMVRELARTATGWRLTIGSAADPEYLDADAVIIAVPAAPAARLLTGTAGEAATQLAAIPYSSMAIVTLAFRAADFLVAPDQVLGRSGYLVPAVDGRAVKAVTFSTIKWPHLAGQAAGQAVGRAPVHVVRCSIGRSGEVAVLQRDDQDLAELAAAELAAATGVTAKPVEHRVTRWGGALPQYNVGHLDRVARIRAAVARHPGLAVAGAAYDGVGIPACISTARSAATQITTHLATRAQP